MIDLQIDAELPAVALEWQDRDGTVIDFSTGWTFSVAVADADAPSTALITKTTNVTGGSTSPNVLVQFTTAELASLASALGTIAATGTDVVIHVTAIRSSDSYERVFRPGDPLRARFHPALS